MAQILEDTGLQEFEATNTIIRKLILETHRIYVIFGRHPRSTLSAAIMFVFLM